MKQKGDQAEREAVAMLVGMAPKDLVVDRPGRKFGAGQMFDVGDLDVFPDVTIQVKWMKSLPPAVLQALRGAIVQQSNAKTAHHLGLARTTGRCPERWLATWTHWPSAPPATKPLGEFGNCPAAIRAITSCDNGLSRHERFVSFQSAATGTVFVGTVETWLHSYRASKEGGE